LNSCYNLFYLSFVQNPWFKFKYLNQFSKTSKFEKSSKSLFEFILVWLQFKFSLKMFQNSLLWIKILESNSKKKKFLKPMTILAHISWAAYFLFSLFPLKLARFQSGPKFPGGPFNFFSFSWNFPCRPKSLGRSAQLGPLGVFSHLRTPEPPPPLPVRHRAMRHHVSPSHARMEMNRSAARPPPLSRTSSTPCRLLSPIQCWNCRVKNPPPADPLPSPPPPPRGYKRPLSHHSTTAQLMSLLVSLLRYSTCSTPSTTAELRSSPPPAQPCHRATRLWPRWAPRRRPLPPHATAVSFGAP
jgi:hypothetical protein